VKTKRTRAIEISVQTEEFLVMKQRRTMARHWCTQCAKEVGMMPLQEFDDCPSVLQRVESGRIHLKEAPKGLFLVCLASLAD
jgi:hypothetical protein